MKRCANFGELRGMLIHHDQSIPNLVSSHLFEVQKFPGKCEEIYFMIPPARYVNGTFAMIPARLIPPARYDTTRFIMKISCPPWPAPIIICRGNFQESFRKRSSHNRSSLQRRDATRVTLGDRFPKGILLTTHDHALLTKNFRALAPE